jgi:protein-disulfide isomerase
MRIVFLSLMLGVSLAACAAAPDHPQLAADQCPLDGEAKRDAMDTTIHDYLTRHPEVLMEMSQALQAKQQAAAAERAKQGIERNRAALFSNPADPVAGNPAASVTIVEFFDAECPFCKKVAPDLARLVAEDPDVRLVFKEYPILGPGSFVAAKAALASMAQGKYEAFHNALMADQTPEHQLAEPRIMAIARSVGLDVKRLKDDMGAGEIETAINGNRALAQAVGITGTPGLIIGDKMVPGAMPYDALKQAVKSVRAERATHSDR